MSEREPKENLVEKKEEPKNPISREDFFFNLEENINISQSKIKDYEHKKNSLDYLINEEANKLEGYIGLLNQIHFLENLGFKLSFFSQEKNIGFDVKGKPKFLG